MSSIEKPYVILVAELIYSEICQIKKLNSDFSNINAIETFIGSKKYKEIGIRTPSPEGMSNGDWVLIDANDILIHIFRPEVRDFYSLEKMWEKSIEEITPDVIKN